MNNMVIRYQLAAGESVRQAYDRTAPQGIIDDLRTRDWDFWAPAFAMAAVTLCREVPLPPPESEYFSTALVELYRLNIAAKEGYGFFLEAIDKVPNLEADRTNFNPLHFYTRRDGPRTDMTRIWMGQNYARVLREFFVDREEAISIVEHFCKNPGGRWPEVRWVESRDSNWIFYHSPEDDTYNPDEP